MWKELKKDKKKKQKVFVAMSGGVDSSVAAFLLKKQGYDTVGVFMKCFNIDGCAEADAQDARRVAEKLKIPFYVWDFEEDYKKKVVEYMVGGYKKGITPNPDVMCNREIKFGLFLQRALKMGADFVATGHYVRSREFRSQYKLLEAHDLNKDQSYFLWTLTQEQLKYCIFPIGDYLKSEVRKIARKAGLPTAEKKDSQGICFLGKVSLFDFLKKYIKEKRGKIISQNGKKIGEHRGAQFYTIGQREGLGIGGFAKPLYVVDKDVKKNIVIVAEGSDNPILYKDEIKLIDVNWIKPLTIVNHWPLGVYARVRYRQSLFKANLYKLKAKSYKLIFNEPQKFIAPGQSAVFYDKKGEMIGGGVIV